MGRKKRPSAQQNNGQQQDNNDPKKKARINETGESYLVKKYRPTKIYTAMEAFVKYTKSHRMLDAAYIRTKIGVTADKPFVFSTRVGGVDLGWGRGKNREAAMDCACRAAFALVAAHGYNNFPLDEDCLMQAPSTPLPPPPPPPPPNLHPPLPPGLPPYGHPHHLPPLPNGMMPPLPPGLPPPLATLPPSADLIPQAKMISDTAPTASSLSSTLGSSSTSEVGGLSTSCGKSNPVVPTISISLNSSNQGLSSELNTRNGKGKRKLKGGLSLVYGVDGEGYDEISMEETRALLPRYQKLLSRATTSSSIAKVSS